MNLPTYQKQLEQYIVKDQLDKALKRLVEILHEGQKRDDVLGYLSRLAALEKERKADTMEEREYTIQRNKLLELTLQEKSKLTLADLDPALELREGILERLVVYCTTERQSFFARLLDPSVFKHIDYLSYAASVPPHTDVIIYDYIPTQETALQQLIKRNEGPAVLIMTYPHLPWLRDEQYRDRCATANSIYSLGARLQELITVREWMNR